MTQVGFVGFKDLQRGIDADSTIAECSAMFRVPDFRYTDTSSSIDMLR